MIDLEVEEVFDEVQYGGDLTPGAGRTRQMGTGEKCSGRTAGQSCTSAARKSAVEMENFHPLSVN